MFGEECFLNKDLNLLEDLKVDYDVPRTSTIYCHSLKGILYKIHKRDILERFWDPQTKALFKLMITNVRKFREERLRILNFMSSEAND